jgi:LytR cell envelope-related transcriptional attenuator
MARRRPTEPTVNPARGAVLVIVAVLIGLFLLREGLDTSEAVTATGDDDTGEESTDDTSTDDTGTDDTSTDDTTETTEAAELRPPAEVPTIVLNNSGVTGAAGTYSDVLAAAGYQLTNPDGDNAAEGAGDRAVTSIYFLPGFEGEAAAVGAAIGAPETVVPAALPTPPPGPVAGASVVVVLGTDLANTTPTTAAAAT